VLPEIQVPPLLFHRVVHRAPLFALRTGKLRSLFKIQPQLQSPFGDIHFAFDHFPSIAQSQGFFE
jgi:hypothetical protein